MDIGSLTGQIAIEDQLSGQLNVLSAKVAAFAQNFDGALGAVAIGVGAGVAALVAMGAAVAALGNRGADINDVAATLDQFAGNAKNAEAIMAQLQRGTMGTVDNFDLMKSSSRLLAAGLKLTATDFGTLSDAAFMLQNQGLGPTKDMLDMVAQALLTGRTRSLEMKIGKIDLSRAEGDYAKTLGISEEQLSAVQKTEAKRLGLLTLLADKVKEQGVVTRDFGEQLEFIQVQYKNLVDDVASAVAKSAVLEAGMNALSLAFETAFGAANTGLVTGVVSIVEEFAVIVINVGIAGVETARVFNVAWSSIKTVVLGVGTVVLGLVTGIGEVLLKAEQLAGKLHLVDPGEVQRVKDTQMGLRAMTASMAEQTAEAAKGVVGQSAFDKTLDKVGGTLLVVRDAMKNAQGATDTGTEAAKAHKKASDDQAGATLKLTDAQKKYAEALTEYNSKTGADYATVMDKIGAVLYEGIVADRARGISTESLAQIYHISKATVEDVIKAEEKWKESQRTLVEMHKIEHGALDGLKDVITAVDDRELRFVNTQIALVAAMKMVEKSVPPVVAGFNSIALNLESVGQKSDEIDKIKLAFQVTDQAAAKFSKTLSGQLFDVLKSVPQTITNALTSGGGFLGAAKAIGSQIGSTIGQSVGEMIGKGASGIATGVGKLAGPIGAALGSLVGPLISGLTYVFSGGAEHVINPIREAFVQLNGGLDKLNVKAHDAGMTLDAMLNAKNPEQYKKAIDDLNAAFKFQDDALQLLDDTAAKYGLTLADMGPKYAQGKLDEQFLTLYQDQKVLQAGGVEYDTILGKQAASYQTLIDQALATGSTIPIALQPALADLVKMGLVTDASGEKMTDLSELTFAETLDTKFKTLIATIEKLVDAIANKLGTAIANIPTVDVDVNLNAHWNTPEFQEPIYAAKGAVIPFTPRGTDVVPAMLSPGEVVTSRSDASAQKAELATLRKELSDIRQLLAGQPDVLGVKLREAIALLPRRVA